MNRLEINRFQPPEVINADQSKYFSNSVESNSGDISKKYPSQKNQFQELRCQAEQTLQNQNRSLSYEQDHLPIDSQEVSQQFAPLQQHQENCDQTIQFSQKRKADVTSEFQKLRSIQNSSNCSLSYSEFDQQSTFDPPYPKDLCSSLGLYKSGNEQENSIKTLYFNTNFSEIQQISSQMKDNKILIPNNYPNTKEINSNKKLRSETGFMEMYLQENWRLQVDNQDSVLEDVSNLKDYSITNHSIFDQNLSTNPHPFQEKDKENLVQQLFEKNLFTKTLNPQKQTEEIQSLIRDLEHYRQLYHSTKEQMEFEIKQANEFKQQFSDEKQQLIQFKSMKESEFEKQKMDMMLMISQKEQEFDFVKQQLINENKILEVQNQSLVDEIRLNQQIIVQIQQNQILAGQVKKVPLSTRFGQVQISNESLKEFKRIIEEYEEYVTKYTLLLEVHDNSVKDNTALTNQVTMLQQQIANFIQEINSYQNQAHHQSIRIQKLETQHQVLQETESKMMRNMKLQQQQQQQQQEQQQINMTMIQKCSSCPLAKNELLNLQQSLHEKIKSIDRFKKELRFIIEYLIQKQADEIVSIVRKNQINEEIFQQEEENIILETNKILREQISHLQQKSFTQNMTECYQLITSILDGEAEIKQNNQNCHTPPVSVQMTEDESPQQIELQQIDQSESTSSNRLTNPNHIKKKPPHMKESITSSNNFINKTPKYSVKTKEQQQYLQAPKSPIIQQSTNKNHIQNKNKIQSEPLCVE